MKFWMVESRGPLLICMVSEKLQPRAESSRAKLMYSPLASGSTGMSLLVVAERGVGVTVASKGDSRGPGVVEEGRCRGRGGLPGARGYG